MGTSINDFKNVVGAGTAPTSPDGEFLTRAEFDRVCDAWNGMGRLDQAAAMNWLREKGSTALVEGLRYGAAAMNRDVGWQHYQLLKEL